MMLAIGRHFFVEEAETNFLSEKEIVIENAGPVRVADLISACMGLEL